MENLTKNQKDYLFKISTFIKEFVLTDTTNDSVIEKRIRDYVPSLVDEDVIDEDSIDILTDCLKDIMRTMIDNPNPDRFA